MASGPPPAAPPLLVQALSAPREREKVLRLEAELLRTLENPACARPRTRTTPIHARGTLFPPPPPRPPSPRAARRLDKLEMQPMSPHNRKLVTAVAERFLFEVRPLPPPPAATSADHGLVLVKRADSAAPAERLAKPPAAAAAGSPPAAAGTSTSIAACCAPPPPAALETSMPRSSAYADSSRGALVARTSCGSHVSSALRKSTGSAVSSYRRSR